MTWEVATYLESADFQVSFLQLPAAFGQLCLSCATATARPTALGSSKVSLCMALHISKPEPMKTTSRAQSAVS